MESPSVAVDGHVVVVENDKKIGVALSGVVEAFQRQSAGHRPVTDHRHGLGSGA